MKVLISYSLSILMVFLTTAYAQPRVFRDQSGRTLTAEWVQSNDTEVSLKLADGKIATLPITTLSAEDQAYVKQLANSKADQFKKINEALGFNIFNEQPLLQKKADQIAQVFNLPIESTSSIGNSWRLYTVKYNKQYSIAGAMPYSTSLYSDEAGNFSSFSAVFANKGDYNSNQGFGSDHFKKIQRELNDMTLNEAIKKDAATIKNALTLALGEPVKQRFGDTKTRADVQRWDINGVSFLLSEINNEYTSLMIVSSELADETGRTKVIDDQTINQRLLAAVEKKDNGDVWIEDIPMVDQGPKGYCVPATFERAMRYMGVSADMYMLALIANTSATGGTSMSLIFNEVESTVRRKGRKIQKDNNNKIDISDVKKHIDKGVPIMWTMFSTDEYNKIASQNTIKRKNMNAEYTAWMTTTRKELSNASQFEDPKRAHICIIIGYNSQTKELAVSDSWGEKAALRWIPLELAQAASQHEFFIIKP